MTGEHRVECLHAKIVYYGPAGAGLTSNIDYIHRKLRRELRGELKRIDLRGESYEFLPIELGSVRDVPTSVHIHTVPTGEGHRGLRRELLDGVDGIVLVADLRPMRHDATVAALAELREHLATFKRSLDDVPLVVQYNRRDLADENSLDALHRRLALRPAATFEAVASEGTGVLQTLTSLTKLILNRLRREHHDRQQAEASARAAAPAAPPVAAIPRAVEVDPLEPTVMAEHSGTFDGPLVAEPAVTEPADKGLRLVDAGPIEAAGDELCIPIRLLEETTGREISLSLRLVVDRT